MPKKRGYEVVVHELKSDPNNFIDVLRKKKKAEIRRNDREFEAYDYILLRQTEYSADAMKLGKPLVYTGRTKLLKITHVQSGYGLKNGYAALSFEVLD